MNQELSEKQIYSKIEEIYNSEKGKGFITHLIRSFFPINRSSFMFSKNDKKPLFCAITRVPLITKEEVLTFQLNNTEEIFKNFVERINGNDVENIMSKQFKGKLLAIECENSTKLLSSMAYKQLHNFLATQILKDNKHISFVIKDEMKKEAKANHKPNTAPVKQQAPQEKKPSILKSTTKLGDMDALVKLKEKFEKEGK